MLKEKSFIDFLRGFSSVVVVVVVVVVVDVLDCCW